MSKDDGGANINEPAAELRETFLDAMRGKRAPVDATPPPAAGPQSATSPRPNDDDDPERARFLKGFARRQLPENALAIVTTNRLSPWYRTKRCAECHHTFRIDDPVMLCPECGRVYHQHPLHGLECFAIVHEHDGACQCGWEIPQRPPPAVVQAAEGDASRFLGGLARSWHTYDDVETLTVSGDNAYLQGQLCAVCGDSVRLNEMVIHCPCGHGPEGHCASIIHHDLGRRLHCWNEWNEGHGRAWCPTTGQPYTRAPAGDDR